MDQIHLIKRLYYVQGEKTSGKAAEHSSLPGGNNFLSLLFIFLILSRRLHTE